MLKARLALAALWCSQVARITADNCLRSYIVRRAAAAGPAAGETAWLLAAALFVLPALLLAPVNGAVSNSLPKRRVLLAAAGYCLAVVAVFAAGNGGWLWCLGLCAVGNAIYSPARYGLLPAAAHDGRLPLPRVNGWIEMGSVAAVIAGLVLGLELYDGTWDQLGLPQIDLPVPVAAVLALNLLGLLTAVPAVFPSDVYRPEPPGEALRGFFRDCVRVWENRETRACLCAIAALRGLVVAATGSVIALNLSQGTEADITAGFHTLLSLAVLVTLGTAGGSLLAGLVAHPTRSLGQVPLAATGLCLCLAAAAVVEPVPRWLYVVVGALGGIINVPLFATYQAALPADARGNGLAVLNAAGYACMSGPSLLMAGLAHYEILNLAGRFWLLAALAAAGAALAWRALLRDSYDLVLSFLFAPFYRIRSCGPGLEYIPRDGPLLVIANHTAWFDPVWLGKVLPRRLVGMLTAEFYDKPVLHFLAKHVVQAIRVEQSSYRHEAPELSEAVAALDRGECVLLFPEGQMRKREDKLLHRFGRGVWHILRARPATPVLVCWIEGGWGSFTSYYHGPPTRNKRVDCRRWIWVAVGLPQPLDAAVLAGHRETRAYLMEQCLAARRWLGLPDVPAATPAGKDDGEDA